MFGFLPISIRLPKPTFFRVEKHIKEDENKKMGGVCGREHALSAFKRPPKPPPLPPVAARWQKRVARNQESPQASPGGVLKTLKAV